MILLRFIRGAEQGWAKYDEESEEYSWEYDGNDDRIEGLLSMPDRGRRFTEMKTEPVESDENEPLEPAVVNEWSEELPWDRHFEELERALRGADCKAEIL